LILTPKARVDSEKVIKMALIHDLAEAKVGDITPLDGISKKEKHDLEEKAMIKLVNSLDNGKDLLSLWKEFEEGKTKEAKFVKRLDKLEMMFQAYEYGITQPRVNLREFWDNTETFDFEEVQQIYNQLKKLRRK
jgi:putative hydrolase of HD superfamily